MTVKNTFFTGLLAAGIILGGCAQNDDKDATDKTESTEDKVDEKTEEATTEAHDHDHDHKDGEEGHDHEHEDGEEAHDHDHEHEHAHGHMTKEEKKIYDGYFEDSQVKDREITDYQGDWQSVYPYLEDGTLDEVFEHKAEDGKMTKEEYKEYYDTGYKTDVDRINIEKDGTITFYKNGDKDKSTGHYVYDGKEILQYEKGNRGVRYIFKKESGDEAAPKYIQFSDHNIEPKLASHFHIFMGDDNKKLLDEMDNWPTYYFSDLSGDEVKEEMLAH